jgi:hypothetical protein
MILQVPRMAPHVARHVAALAKLGAHDAGRAAAVYGRFATRLAIAGVAGLLALGMACTLIMAAAWDTDYRTWAAGGLTALFAIAALVTLSSARRGAAKHAPFATLKRNLDLDRKLYADLWPATLEEPQLPPEEQLAQSREEIRRVAENSAAAEETLRFPRSRTMQVLTRSGPAGSAALLAYLLQRRRTRRRA